MPPVVGLTVLLSLLLFVVVVLRQVMLVVVGVMRMVPVALAVPKLLSAVRARGAAAVAALGLTFEPWTLSVVVVVVVVMVVLQAVSGV